jgi:hypothetical protein
LKENNLINSFIWPFITSGRAPLDDLFALEKTLINDDLRSATEHLLGFHPSPEVETAFNSYSFPLEAPRLLPAILVVTRRFAHMRSGATMREAAE